MKKCLFSFTAGVVLGASFLFYFAEKGRKLREERENTTRQTCAPKEEEDDSYDYNADDELKDW